MDYFLLHALSSIVLHKSTPLRHVVWDLNTLFHLPAPVRGLDHPGGKSAISIFDQSTSWAPHKRLDLTNSSPSALIGYVSRARNIMNRSSPDGASKNLLARGASEFHAWNAEIVASG
jgi:hypothetical protein